MMDAAPPQYLADVYERLVGAPSAAPADRERRLSDVTEDDLSLESTSPAFRVCTLNIGGRNTNSFEFEMRGDATQLGTRWGELFGRANAFLAEHGPASCPGLEAAVDTAVVAVAPEPRPGAGILAKVLAAASWEDVQREVLSTCPMLFNACNLASLRAGRPAPLEMPENLLERTRDAANDGAGATVAFQAVWLAWLAGTSEADRAAWTKRAKKYGVSLGDAVAGLLVFDSMCFEVLKHMYAPEKGYDDTNNSCGAIVSAHLAFHDRLHFTTELGKYTKLLELLAELRFPEVVCLQEAYDLVVVARGGTSTLSARMFSMFADKYHVTSAGESAVLARKDAFLLDDVLGDDVGAAAPWRKRLAAVGSSLYGEDGKLQADWETTLSRTVVVQARRVRVDAAHDEPTRASLLPARWALVDAIARKERPVPTRPKAAPVPVVLACVHGKGASEVGVAFVPALVEALTAAFGDAQAYVIGMDSNTGNSDAFTRALLGCGAMSERAADLEARTVAKRRSRLQTQVKKAGVLDVSLKDFIVAWAREGGEKVPLVEVLEQFPSLKSGHQIKTLMPTARWPFDHALLVTQVLP